MTFKKLSISFTYNFLLDGLKQLLKHRQYVSPETTRYTDIDNIIANRRKPSLIHPSIMVPLLICPMHIITQIGSISAAIIECPLTYYEHMFIIYTCHARKNAGVLIVRRTRFISNRVVYLFVILRRFLSISTNWRHCVLPITRGFTTRKQRNK